MKLNGDSKASLAIFVIYTDDVFTALLSSFPSFIVFLSLILVMGASLPSPLNLLFFLAIIVHDLLFKSDKK